MARSSCNAASSQRPFSRKRSQRGDEKLTHQGVSDFVLDDLRAQEIRAFADEDPARSVEVFGDDALDLAARELDGAGVVHWRASARERLSRDLVAVDGLTQT